MEQSTAPAGTGTAYLWAPIATDQVAAWADLTNHLAEVDGTEEYYREEDLLEELGHDGVDPARVVIVHDELDIPFDAIKLKTGGGHGGHNGVRDVAKALDSAEFARVRVGIGRPTGRQDPADWVLEPFGSTERKNLPILLEDAADAVEQLVDEGLLAAQQKHHAPRV